MELVARLEYGMSADLQFQRRIGPQVIDGAQIDGTRDVLFASAHGDINRVDGGIEIIDVTRPETPARLARIPCPGYQSDVAVAEKLLIQTIDWPQSNVGCDADWLRSSGSSAPDRVGAGGVRIFDVADPARPRLMKFVPVATRFGAGIHDVTVLPWAGVAFLTQLDGNLGILDLGDSDFGFADVAVATISSEMTSSCHDVGLDPVRELAFCAASEDKTYILDVSDATNPTLVTTIANASLSRHHGALMAPDGKTLVLQSEFDHPPEISNSASGGIWFYDLTEPTHPALLGSWAPASCVPDEHADRACTSHWFNFVPGTRQLISAWRQEGLFAVDYGVPSAPVEVASYLPATLGSSPTDFWAAYYWHGFVYGSATRGETGLHVLRYPSLVDSDPSPFDEGSSWARWSGPSALGSTAHAHVTFTDTD